MALFLANIGKRDLLYDGQECNPARGRGAEILEAYKDESARLGFPIFGRAFEHIKNIRGERRQGLEIIIFVTDQADPAYSSSDTIEFGKIIKRHFGASGYNIKLQLVDQSPHAYDIMFRLYGEKLKAIRKKSGLPEKVYVLATGGTPACNMALLFHSIAQYGRDVEPLYVEPDRPVTTTNIAVQLMDNFARRAILNYVKSNDYEAVLGVEGVPENLKSLAEAAQARLNFDFASAYELFSRVRSAEPVPTVDLIPLQSHLAQIIEKDEHEALLRELAVNMKIKYRQRQYADLLGRLFRLEEALLQWAAYSYGGIRVGKKNKAGEYPEFIEGIRANEGLEEHLETIKSGGSDLRYEEPSRPTLNEIVKFLAGAENVRDGRVVDVLDCANSIRNFSELRNNSIIAHGFKGISREDLEKIGIEAVLERVEELVEVKPEISFEPVNKCIERMLDYELP